MLKKFALKLLTCYSLVRYPSVCREYIYFLRDNYFARLRQFKYLYKDYISKPKYKVISFNGEFQQELLYVLPFAYWHHQNGTLVRTRGAKDTQPFYFFSNDHIENFDSRDWMANFKSYDIPNMNHCISLSQSKWRQVPFKSFYKNDRFKFAKETLVIANKYNIEWDSPPLNYFEISVLQRIIEEFKDKYQIVYNRPLSSQIVSDNSDILDLNEYGWLKENYPEVILMNDLYLQNASDVGSFNELQLLVYANCDRFISVHGGTATLASCFGGVNVILSKRGIEHDLNEFNNIFPKLSSAMILHAKDEAEIFVFLSKYF